MTSKSFLLDNFLGRSFYLTKWATHFSFIQQTRNKPFLLVYQMGKVGSTSILESVVRLDLQYAIFHIHFLTKSGIRQEEYSYFGDTPRYRRKSLWPKTKHLFVSFFLSSKVSTTKPSACRWKVITLVRDPIARNISDFFQRVERISPALLMEESQGRESVKQLHDLFLNKDPLELDFYPYRWFETELKPALGIDIFATEFPKEIGYQIYHGKLADLLLLRLESLHEIAEEAFREFLGIENFVIIRSNEARNKSYAPIYDDFIKTLKLPKNFIDDQYKNNPVNHFYSEEEIDMFRKKWGMNRL